MKRFSLSKNERLRLTKDFERVFREGKMLQNEFFTVIFAKNNLGYSRLGIIVKKKFGKAHDRNKVKRWIREIFRHHKVNFKEGYDVLVIPRKTLSVEFHNVDFHRIKDSLIPLFEEMEKS